MIMLTSSHAETISSLNFNIFPEELGQPIPRTPLLGIILLPPPPIKTSEGLFLSLAKNRYLPPAP